MPRPVLTIKRPYSPEMLTEAAGYIEGLLSPAMEVFEYGSGYSTVWLAERVERVVFVEHDPLWFVETNRALKEAKVVSKTKGYLVEEEGDMAGHINRYGLFDMVLVDCLDRQRPAAIKEAVEHIRPGGYLVVDDSNWSALVNSCDWVRSLGWQDRVFYGPHRRKNNQVHKHQTTIFRRPSTEEEE